MSKEFMRDLPAKQIALTYRSSYAPYSSQIEEMINAMLMASKAVNDDVAAAEMFISMLEANRVNGFDFGIFNDSLVIIPREKLINIIKENTAAAIKAEPKPISAPVRAHMVAIVNANLYGKAPEAVQYLSICYSPTTDQYGDAQVESSNIVKCSKESDILQASWEALSSMFSASSDILGNMFNGFNSTADGKGNSASCTDGNDSSNSLMAIDAVTRSTFVRTGFCEDTYREDSEAASIIEDAKALDARINAYLLTKAF